MKFRERVKGLLLANDLNWGSLRQVNEVATVIDQEHENDLKRMHKDVLEKTLKNMPPAPFIPDNATQRANDLGTGLASYRYSVQEWLIDELKRVNKQK